MEETLDFGAIGSFRWQRQLFPVAGGKGETNRVMPATVGSGVSEDERDIAVAEIGWQQSPEPGVHPRFAQQDDSEDSVELSGEQARVLASLPAIPVATARTAAVTNPRMSMALDMDKPLVTFPLMHSIDGANLVNNDRSPRKSQRHSRRSRSVESLENPESFHNP